MSPMPPTSPKWLCKHAEDFSIKRDNINSTAFEDINPEAAKLHAFVSLTLARSIRLCRSAHCRSCRLCTRPRLSFQPLKSKTCLASPLVQRVRVQCAFSFRSEGFRRTRISCLHSLHKASHFHQGGAMGACERVFLGALILAAKVGFAP